ncbi:S1C family serine protease [Crossiella cryophila]|uniref:S1-C subfamily serine protease n=1 Tax=Crossiella cryophila TaxID=43355 RepID=A0A7W7FQM2_9PSEU|nr:trypsin-like peptidase domain-containing protein [Crossiella cryophila]MBB4674000.1 S1-C subfamily serine protease [Crossiella cryophila]
MSEQQPSTGQPGAGERPRLEPRPLHRPAVDPAQSAVFSRPTGVDSAFDPHRPETPGNGIRLSAPPPEALSKAFGRPANSPELLQRPPGEQPVDPRPEPEPVLWSANGQPEGPAWRDPAAGAVLGPPAGAASAAPSTPRPALTGPGARLSLRELAFGKRLTPAALLGLVGFVLVISLVGGVVGRLTAEGANPLNDPDATLAEVSPGKEREPGSLASLAKKVLPSVVSIEVRLGDSGGLGSGVVIDGKGYVITNNHVVEMAANAQNAKVEVVFHDSQRAPARIVGRDPKNDLAVLKVEVSNLTVAQIGKSGDLQVGDKVIAIGNPLGLAGSVSEGIVSAVNRPFRIEDVVFNAVQTDAAINQGNSGGALVDSTGALIGINTAIVSRSGGSVGLGFAIPIDDAKVIAEALIRGGTVKHPDIGLNLKSVMNATVSGAQVQNVVQNGSAAAAGIQEGDVILKLGERNIKNADELLVAVQQHKIGETVPVLLARQGRQLTLNVTLKSD